jgi:hypothetical protein
MKPRRRLMLSRVPAVNLGYSIPLRIVILNSHLFFWPSKAFQDKGGEAVIKGRVPGL